MTEDQDQSHAIEFKYKAFISYSHRDAAWGDWLHQALERYRVPKKLVGTKGRTGAVPASLFPIFRDREELASSADLPEQIKQALEQSARLVVICSPQSATSRWVNEEILTFKRLGREDQVLAIIVEGEPNAGDKPNVSQALECFPRALRFRLAPDGQPGTVRTEPIAADAREQGDGRDDAIIKLTAGILGVDLNRLKQREVEARHVRLRVQIATVGAIAATFFGVVVYFLLGQTWDANADQFFTEARGDLSQRDFARAEIAAAKSLTYRDRVATRELLLTARLGGTRLITDSAGLSASTMNFFSRDGRFVATVMQASKTQAVTVIVSSPADHKELWHISLPASAERADSIAVDEANKSGLRLAIAWTEKSGSVFRAGIWRLMAGIPAVSFYELATEGAEGHHSKRIPSMAFSPVAPWIVTSGEDGKLCLWDLEPKKPKLVWEQAETHDPNVHGIAFNRDGSLLGSGGGDYVAKIWEFALMRGADYNPEEPYKEHHIDPKYELKGHSDSVFAVAFSPDDQKIATGGYDRTVRIWDLTVTQKGKPLTVATLSGHTGTILSLSFSDDGKLLSSGASDGGVGLWDATAGRLLNRFRPDSGAVRSVTSTGFEGGIFIGGVTGWSVWGVNGSSLVARLWHGGSPIGVLAFDPTGRYLAGAGNDDGGRVRIWDQSNHLFSILDPRSDGDSINALAFSPDGTWIAAGGDNRILHIWSRQKNAWSKYTIAGKQPEHGGSIWGLCFDPKGRWVATANQRPNVQIKLWRLPDWSLLTETAKGELHEDSIYSLICDRDGQLLITGDSKAQVTVRKVTDFSAISAVQNVTQGELNVWSMAAVDPMHAILSGNSDGKVRLWRPDHKDWISDRPFEKNPLETSFEDAVVNPTINSVTYDRSRGWVAAGGVGSSIEIYDIKDLRRLRSLRGTDGTIWWVTFDPQGTRLAYGGLDGIVRVVDLEQMGRLDKADAAELYKESQRSTGLTVDDVGRIVEERARELSRPTLIQWFFQLFRLT